VSVPPSYQFRWYSCHGCGWEGLMDEARNQCGTPGCQGALHIHSNVDGELPKRLPKHANSCGNQNPIHPAGAYDGVEECGCLHRCSVA
jgi:hypothetical protein